MDEAQQEQTLQRLHILEAVSVGIERRDEVCAVVAAAADGEDARHKIAAQFGLTEIQAVAILDLQLRRLTQLDRTRIVAERNELRRAAGVG